MPYRRQARVKVAMRQGRPEKDLNHTEPRATKVLQLLASPCASQGSQWLAAVYQATKKSVLISLFSTRTGRSQDLLTMGLFQKPEAAETAEVSLLADGAFLFLGFLPALWPSTT